MKEREQSATNCRFDRWAARHPKMALAQWLRSSPARRANLLKDAPVPELEYNASYTWYAMRKKAKII